MKKPSLAAALQPLDRNAQPAPTAAPSRAPKADAGEGRAARPARKPTTDTAAPPSRVGKKALIGYFDPDVSKQLKQLALDQDSSIQELLREALNDFFSKHKKPTIA